jgi:Holliday junction resolvase RusA-like endonuclease
LTFQTTLFVNPCGKGRPRFGNGRTFTDAKTVAAEAEIRWLLQKENPPLLEGPVALELAAFFLKPKSVSKKRAFHTVKPDGSNILKLFEDAGNGVLWRDDSQIVSAKVTKQYGEPARLEVRVINLGA